MSHKRLLVTKGKYGYYTNLSATQKFRVVSYKSVNQVLVDDTISDETDRNIRQCILSFFSGFDAETLPPPSTEPHVMQNIENPLYQKDISPAFLHKVEYVRKRIFDNSAPKQGFSEGSVISGFRKLCSYTVRCNAILLLFFFYQL